MNKTKTLKPASIVIGSAILALGTPMAFAQDFIKPYDDGVSIYLGGVVNQFDTSLRLDGQGHRGSDINLENNGLKKNLSSFEASLMWRFFQRHRIDVDYYTLTRSGGRTYNGDINIGDTDFPVGASVHIKNKYDLASLDYRYSLFQTPEWETAVGLGLYGGKFTFDVNASGNVGNTGTQGTYNNSVSTTLPLPLLGISVDYHPDARWKFSGRAYGMQAKVSNVDGRAYNFAVDGEYMFTRNFGAGARWMYTNIDVDVTKAGFNGSLTWRANTASLYAKLMF